MANESELSKLDEQYKKYEKLAEINDYLFISYIHEISERCGIKVVLDPEAKSHISANQMSLRFILNGIKKKIENAGKKPNIQRLDITRKNIEDCISNNYNDNISTAEYRETHYDPTNVIGLLDKIELAVRELKKDPTKGSIKMADIAENLFNNRFFTSKAGNSEVMRVKLQNVLASHSDGIKAIPSASKRWPNLNSFTTFNKLFIATDKV